MVVSAVGVCVELLTGCPGRMCDANASQYVCRADWPASTLVDQGYPAFDPRFVLPDGTQAHMTDRVLVEHFLGRNKMNWQMTGGVFRRKSAWHSLCIRGSIILSNMKKIFDDKKNNCFF